MSTTRWKKLLLIVTAIVVVVVVPTLGLWCAWLSFHDDMRHPRRTRLDGLT